jgi:hypothetical protein
VIAAERDHRITTFPAVDGNTRGGRLAVRDGQLAIRDSRLEIGDGRWEIGDWRLEPGLETDGVVIIERA